MTHYSNVIRLLESAKPVKFNLLDRTLEGSIVISYLVKTYQIKVNGHKHNICKRIFD